MSQQSQSGGGLLIGRPFGVPVLVSWTWFLGALLISWVFVPFVESQIPDLEGWAFAVAACFAVLLGLSVLVHELAHAVMAIRLGQQVRGITLHLLGGVSEIVGTQSRPWADFVIAAVGPLASLVVAAVAFGALQLSGTATVAHLVLWQLTAANVIVGLFNLIPGLPLDGGRMLKDAVWGITGRETAGTITAAWIGRVLAVVIVALAVWPILLGHYKVIWLAWGVLLASFIWIEAGRALHTTKLRSLLPRIQVHALARRAVPMFEELPVSEGLRQLGEAQAGAIVTTDRAGHPLGIVNEAAVTALPELRRPWVALSAVARALPQGAAMSPDLGGDDLLSFLAQHPASEYLVTSLDGSVYGVLALADVDAAIARELTRG